MKLKNYKKFKLIEEMKKASQNVGLDLTSDKPNIIENVFNEKIDLNSNITEEMKKASQNVGLDLTSDKPNIIENINECIKIIMNYGKNNTRK